MAEQFDVVVIGGGPGGYVAAIRAAQLGLKTACVEARGTLGGTCLNVGCIPSKALLESSEMYDKVKNHGGSFGVKVDKVVADVTAMLERKDKIVKGLCQGIEGLFKKNKITYLKGHGSFKSATEIEVKDAAGKVSVIQTKNTIIATGSEAVELGIAPFDGKKIVSSTESLDFKDAPKHLVVIGGGYIGLEMGSVWGRLGAKVTVVEAQANILPAMDVQVATAMHKILTKQGFEIHTNTKLVKVDTSGKDVTVICDQGGKEVTFKCDKVLVAVGRRAYTKGLGLEAIGIKAGVGGKITIDKHFRTNVANVYAVGDVVDGPMLAHKAEEEGVACAEIIAGKPGHVSYEAIPGICYTWPEVASVGLSEEACKAQGLAYRVGQFPFIANARARCLGDTDGFVKVIADERTDRLLGIHIVGPRASDMIAEAVIAFEFGGSAEDLARSMHGHPTLSEVMREACLAVDKRARQI